MKLFKLIKDWKDIIKTVKRHDKEVKLVSKYFKGVPTHIVDTIIDNEGTILIKTSDMRYFKQEQNLTFDNKAHYTHLREITEKEHEILLKRYLNNHY